MILFAAALAAMRTSASHAATITYEFYDVLFGTNSTAVTSDPGVILATAVVYAGGSTNTSGSAVITIRPCDFISFGIEATVSDNGGSGLSAFALGITDNNPAGPSIYTTVPTTGSTLAGSGIAIATAQWNSTGYRGHQG